MEPGILEEKQPSDLEQSLETAQQPYIDYLYELLTNQDLLNEHEHEIAHRIIDLITVVRQLHHDIDNPSDASEKKPAFAEMLDALRKFREEQMK